VLLLLSNGCSDVCPQSTGGIGKAEQEESHELDREQFMVCEVVENLAPLDEVTVARQSRKAFSRPSVVECESRRPPRK
jgi:hypothetical protein